jgi:alpha-L-fucosidase
MKNELGELIDNYHPKMLWFDGFWEEPWTNQFGREVYDYIKKKDAHILVNNRLGKNANTTSGKDGEKLNSESVGDFLTPEQRVGQLDMSDPWESCITMCTQWAWKPNDKMKSLKECIQTLTRIAGGNGNLLLNVGPMMDGRMEARQVNRLKEMGNWLKNYGSSIYKTNGGPYNPNEIYSSTRSGNKIYIHVYNAANTLTLPQFPDNTKIEKCYLLGGKELAFDQNPSSPISIKLPAVLPDENCSVIVLEINHPAIEIPVIAEK